MHNCEAKCFNQADAENFAKVRPSCFLLPVGLLLAIAFFLYKEDALNIDSYRQIQKGAFYYVNSRLSQFPNLEFNLTQLGDALVLLSFLTIFIIRRPKIWEHLITSSLVSLLITFVLKTFFSVPRPAATFNNSSFTIIGDTLTCNNSLPSGHTITIFTTLTVLMYGFMPKALKNRILWCLFIMATGLFIALSRVAVGAHYPLDVLIGSIVGYICGITGILVCQKYNLWGWICERKYYPIFIGLFLICCFVLITKITSNNLFIFYLSIVSLAFSSYVFTKACIKR
ncbi:phosphatase PAP2 family protein [Nubsella zeaxanthinifaciens]|uniref:phosphatase PAP2 family protein n=1 Tax=Nubsella zeaxanthinifaciens TaxID=392412 RepID=UPI000DE368B6|nr:phosphatase PAP2 family protein [Nubsella zeaxanthinifaciens]